MTPLRLSWRGRCDNVTTETRRAVKPDRVSHPIPIRPPDSSSNNIISVAVLFTKFSPPCLPYLLCASIFHDATKEKTLRPGSWRWQTASLHPSTRQCPCLPDDETVPSSCNTTCNTARELSPRLDTASRTQDAPAVGLYTNSRRRFRKVCSRAPLLANNKQRSNRFLVATVSPPFTQISVYNSAQTPMATTPILRRGRKLSQTPRGPVLFPHKDRCRIC